MIAKFNKDKCQNTLRMLAGVSFVVASTLAASAALGQEADADQDTETERQNISEQQRGQQNQPNPAAPIVVVPLNNGNGNGNGNGNQACQIIVLNGGTLGASIEGNQLSSKLSNGRAGVAEVTATNSSFSLVVDSPFGFTVSPPGDTSDTTMKSTFLGTGATNFSETPGNIQVRVKRGSTVVETHLIAERASRQAFPPGNYAAELTLRCE